MKRAFTLNELLIVVAIIVIVLAIVAPVLFNSKKAAFKTVCTSNLHQLSLAMMLYRDDNSEYPPNSVSFPAFVAYYPVPLTCPQSMHHEPALRILDYSMMGSPIPFGDSEEETAAAWEGLVSCRTIREGDIPIAMDRNHADRLETFKNPSSFFLIARENGSISRLSSAAAYSAPAICDQTKIPIDYSF